jgi:hypothetical protein
LDEQGLCGCARQTRLVFSRRKAPAEGWHFMDIAHPGALWLIPVILSVGFLLWVLWSFWNDARH